LYRNELNVLALNCQEKNGSSYFFFEMPTGTFQICNMLICVIPTAAIIDIVSIQSTHEATLD